MIGFEGVKKLLKQRFPLIMVDRVIEVNEEHTEISTIRNITGNEICFLGHFPDSAILPGIYMIEALAQSSSIMFSLGEERQLGEGEILVLGGVSNMRFMFPVVPGDRMEMKVKLLKKVEDACIVEGSIMVDGKEAACGKMSFARKKVVENAHV